MVQWRKYTSSEINNCKVNIIKIQHSPWEVGEWVKRAEARRATSPTEVTGSARPSITAIAELLAHFNGVSDSWKVWEKVWEVRLLTTTYRLQDDIVKILIDSRLKGD